MNEYVFEALGEKKIISNGVSLTILNTIILSDIKCAYIKEATESQNGTVYFSLDGNDIDIMNNSDRTFDFAYPKQQEVYKFIYELGIDVFESVSSSLQSGHIIDSTINDVQKKSLWSKVNERAIENKMIKKEEKQSKKDRIKQMDKEGVAYCPKCKSTSLSANKKGFGIGKAVIGAAMTGGIGLIAGNIGAKKIRVTCLKCGHQFWAGKK